MTDDVVTSRGKPCLATIELARMVVAYHSASGEEGGDGAPGDLIWLMRVFSLPEISEDAIEYLLVAAHRYLTILARQ